MNNEDNVKLIQCKNHLWAPWSILCIHLIERPETTEWLNIKRDDGDEVEFDYICPWCDKKREKLGSYDKMIEFLRPVCIHCVRDLRQKAGLE